MRRCELLKPLSNGRSAGMQQQTFKRKDVLRLNGVPFEVARVFPDKVQIENLQTSEVRETTVDKLLQQYTAGALSVEQQSDAAAAELPQSNRANADTSMEQMGEKSRAATLRMVNWVVKVRDMGGFDRPRLLPDVISRIAQERGEEHPPHISTIRRWKRKFELARRDVRSMFCRMDLRGGRGCSRLGEEV